MENDFLFWLDSSVTNHLRDLIKKEIQHSKDLAFLEPGFINSQCLERDYAKALGYIQGLEFVERIFKEMEKARDEDEITRTLSR